MTRPFTMRYRIRLGVGLFWLIAGGLQLQSFMFTKEFSSDVLGSSALSQPAPLDGLITAVEHAVGAHPAVWNWPFALIQLGIGLGLIVFRTGRVARLAAAASIAWGLGVWLIGEGAGTILTGHAALSTGAPGAALIYSLLTIYAWPRPTPEGEQPLPARALTLGWVALWWTGALWALLPNQWGSTGLGAQAAMGWMMSPSWTVGPAHAVMTWLLALNGPAAVAVSLTVVVVQLILGAAVLLRGRARTGLIIAAMVLSLGFWIFAQGFGGLSTGTATDVGTAPLIMLFGMAILWIRSTDEDREPIVESLRDSEYESIRLDRSHRRSGADSRGLQLLLQEHAELRGGTSVHSREHVRRNHRGGRSVQ
jgi:hypothetical protein